MQDVTELLFKVVTQDDLGLDKVDQTVKRIVSDSGLSGQALVNLEQTVRKAFEVMVNSGLNFEQMLKRLAASGDSIGRGVSGAAKDIQKDLKNAADAAANLEKRQKALQQASSGLQNAIGSPLAAIGTLASNAAAALGPVGIGLTAITVAATLGGKALFDFVDNAAQAAQQTVNLAERLGISAGAMKRLQVEAQIVGINFQSVTMATRTLALGLEDSTGSGKRAAQALKDLGVSMQTTSGAARDVGGVYLDSIARLAALTDHTKQVEEATRLFGRSAVEILPLIENYKELDKTARQLGYGDTTQLNLALAKGEEQINKMGVAWDLFKAKIAVAIEPIVIPVTRLITDIVTGNNKENVSDRIEALQDRKGGFPLLSPRQLEAVRAPKFDISKPLLEGPLGLDLAGGRAITSQFAAGRAGTDEGRRALIQANTEELTKLNNILANAARDPTHNALSHDTAFADRARVRVLEQENRSLEDVESRAKKARAEILRLTDEAKYPDLQSPIEFRKLIAERQKSLELVGAGHEDLVNGSQTFGVEKIQESIRKFFDKIAASVQKDAEKTVKDEDRHSPFDEQNIAFKKYLKDQVQISEALLSESQKQLRIINAGDRDDSKRQQARAVQLAGLDGGGGGLSAINRGTSARENDAAGLRADSLRQVKELEDGINDSIKAEGERSVDDEKQLASLSTRRLEIEEEYWKEIGDARLDQELKIAELQKKQLESYKRQGEEIFSALQRPNGLREFFKGQANQLFGGLFSNATAPILQKVGQSLGGLVPGQTDADGKKTGIGKLVSGTILDSDRAAPQIKATDLNTRAIDLNTQATNNLRKVLAGTSAPASGSPADAVSQLVSSSAATSGSPAQALQIMAGADGQGGAASPGSPAAALTQIAAPASKATDSLLSGIVGAGGAAALLGGGIGSLVTSAQRATQHSESYSVPTGGGAYTPVKGGSAGSGASPQLLSLLAGGGSVGLTAALGVASSISKASAGSASPSPLAPSGRVSVNDPLLFANLPSAPKYTGPPTGLAGLLSGVSSTGQSGNFDEILHGGAPTFNPATGQDGTTPTFSTSQRVGAAVGDAAVAGTGAYEAYKQFSKGGASGVLGGIGASAGTAAILDPEPISKSILGAISAGSELLKAIFPDPKTIRQADIANQTQYNAYVAPPTLNRQLSSGGDETYTNKYGQLQVSPYSSIQETQPYKYQSPVKDPSGLLANWETQPGQIIEPYQSATPEPSYATAYAPNLMAPYAAPPPTPVSTSGYGQQGGGTMSITINALDSQSVLDRSSDIATAVQREVRNGHPVGLALQQSLVGT